MGHSGGVLGMSSRLIVALCVVLSLGGRISHASSHSQAPSSWSSPMSVSAEGSGTSLAAGASNGPSSSSGGDGGVPSTGPTSTHNATQFNFYDAPPSGLSNRDRAAIVIITLSVAAAALIVVLVTCLCLNDKEEVKVREDGSSSGGGAETIFGHNDAQSETGGSTYTGYTASSRYFPDTPRSVRSFVGHSPIVRSSSRSVTPTRGRQSLVGNQSFGSRRPTGYQVAHPPDVPTTATPRHQATDTGGSTRIEIPPTASSYTEMYLEQQRHVSEAGAFADEELYSCDGSGRDERPRSSNSFSGDYAVDINALNSKGGASHRQNLRVDSKMSGMGGDAGRGVRFVDDDDTDTATNQRSSTADFNGLEGLRRCAHCGSTFRGAMNICPVAGQSHRQLFDELQQRRKAKREIQRRMRTVNQQQAPDFNGF